MADCSFGEGGSSSKSRVQVSAKLGFRRRLMLAGVRRTVAGTCGAPYTGPRKCATVPSCIVQWLESGMDLRESAGSVPASIPSQQSSWLWHARGKRSALRHLAATLPRQTHTHGRCGIQTILAVIGSRVTAAVVGKPSLTRLPSEGWDGTPPTRRRPVWRLAAFSSCPHFTGGNCIHTGTGHKNYSVLLL